MLARQGDFDDNGIIIDEMRLCTILEYAAQMAHGSVKNSISKSLVAAAAPAILSQEGIDAFFLEVIAKLNEVDWKKLAVDVIFKTLGDSSNGEVGISKVSYIRWFSNCSDTSEPNVSVNKVFAVRIAPLDYGPTRLP